MKPFVSVKGLDILDEELIPLVRNVSFDIPKGEVFFLVGETGCGKTLVAQTVARTLPERLTPRGSVRLAGQEIMELQDEDRRALWGRSLFLMPQEPFEALAPQLSVRRQLRDIYQHVLGRERNCAAHEADVLLSSLDIPPGWRKARPRRLSGGMAQRVLLAMALASPAEFILLDEPTKGLDPQRRGDAVELIRGLIAKGKTLLCITHDLTLPIELGGRVGVMYGGLLLEAGVSEDVLSSPSHPYTQGLLNAMPERGLHPIPDALLDSLEKAWTP